MYTVSDGHSTGSPPHGSDSDSGDRILRRIKDSELMIQRRSARRGRKQDAERKRRERLNHSMIALKELVCGKTETHNEDPNSDDSKLEKAQILEATVQYVRQKQQEEQRTPPTHHYSLGFNRAAQLTVDFLNQCDQDVAQRLQAGLQDYLRSKKAQELEENGSEAEATKSDGSGKCRSPMKLCRAARHNPTQALGREKHQNTAALRDSVRYSPITSAQRHAYPLSASSQTPSPIPSPRAEHPGACPSRQSFGPVNPNSTWAPAMYPPVSAYPSPTASPLQRGFVAPEGFVSPVVSGPQLWVRSGGENTTHVVATAAPYCVRDVGRLNTPHHPNDSGYFSPSIAAISPYTTAISPYTTPRGVYLSNAHVGVLNLSNRKISSDAQPTTAVSSPAPNSVQNSAPAVSPDSVTDSCTPRRASADSTRMVTSSTGLRGSLTSPVSVDENSRGSVVAEQPLSPEDKEIATILKSAGKPTVQQLSTIPSPTLVPSHPAIKVVLPASRVTAPVHQIAAPVAIEPSNTWRPW